MWLSPPKPPPNLACTSSNFLSSSVSKETNMVSNPKGTASRIRISIGVSFRGKAFPGEMICKLCRKDWRAGDRAGNWTEECGREDMVSGLEAARTGRIVHDDVWVETTDAGCHGAMATWSIVFLDCSSSRSAKQHVSYHPSTPRSTVIPRL